MNRNFDSHFSQVPAANITRSVLDRSHTIKTSFNAGDLVPFYVDEVLPGDTVKLNTSKVVRMSTPLDPIMDNIYLDTYYFFVPMRLVWDHSKEFFGENSESPWTPETEYTIPQIEAPSGGWITGTIADYMGLPIGVDDISVSALPFRAYAAICNYWFRSEVVGDPLNYDKDETTITGSNGDTFVTDVVKGGMPYKANKFFDYFTSCLPYPQKGPDVTISGVGGSYPVYGNGNLLGVSVGFLSSTGAGGLGVDYSHNVGVVYKNAQTFPTSLGAELKVKDYNYGASNPDDVNFNSIYGSAQNHALGVGVLTKDQVTDPAYTGLYADGSTQVATTINQLRMAFQIQKLYERDARSGTRYSEIIKSHFGVTSPDSRLQNPEYLGGNRVPVCIHQIAQSSATGSGSTPQGHVAAYSQTVDSHSDFTHSFTEHGFLIGIMVARYDHSYQQGISRMWSRSDRFDYYWPVLANIGEQSVLNKEIFADGTSADSQTFGYQEAWAEYRYCPNKITGQMRSAATGSLDVWHLADDYSELPTLSEDWLFEDKDNIDRTLAVKSTVSNQFFGDFYIKGTWTRPMPVYSVPGLIDHH